MHHYHHIRYLGMFQREYARNLGCKPDPSASESLPSFQHRRLRSSGCSSAILTKGLGGFDAGGSWGSFWSSTRAAAPSICQNAVCVITTLYRCCYYSNLRCMLDVCFVARRSIGVVRTKSCAVCVSRKSELESGDESVRDKNRKWLKAQGS